MKKCKKYKSLIKDEEGQKFHSKLLCKDCYIDEIMPKMPRSHYNNDAEFMNRLKDLYPVHIQQYH